ncbi:MAG: TonB family protein [Deltaproteobacteria bacterium]|nr:TonB family protein [Deltaproteobacteria bacterium]
MTPRHTNLRSALLGALASVATHVVIYAWLQSLPVSSASANDLDRQRLIELPASAFAGQSPSGRRAREALPTVNGGPRSAQNVSAESRGERGDDSGAVEFTLLVDRAHPVNLQDSPLNAIGAAQTQRIRTAADRAAWENMRRASPNPADAPFLASGDGPHPERRPLDPRDAMDGARLSPGGAVLGDRNDRAGALGPSGGRGPSTRGDSGAANQRSARAGAEREAPTRGIVGGRGDTEQQAADSAFARPSVDRGPATTTAERTGRVRDDRDAELLAAQLLQSVVDSSQRRGPRPGIGNGGVGGGGAPGSGGGEGEGGRATAHGPGSGRHGALDTGDPRYIRWYTDQRRRVERVLSFPEERALAMDQGLTVVSLRVRRDGSLAGPPRRKRSSGFSDFDAEALRAIRAVAPFEPLPAELAPERDVLVLDMTIDFQNPMVR